MYPYIKALHIIFIITWFAGIFYMPRLFIYNTEADVRPEDQRAVLREQFGIMSRRLWYGITWPSAVLTLILGTWMAILYNSMQQWLWIKLVFVVLLYGYHFTLHAVFKQQQKGIFKYSSQQLRIWNEVATVLLIAIVMLASVKQAISVVWGIAGLAFLIVALLAAIRIYKRLRK